jgi:hypothetical protein
MRRSSAYTQVILSFTFILLFLSLQSMAGTADTAKIIVMGTVHSSSDNFDPGKLAAIIDRIGPDLILVELDSSFFTPGMAFKPETIGLSLENKAVSIYLKDHKVPVRPYEIEGRNRIYQEHDYFRLQKELSAALKKAVQDSILVPEANTLLESLHRFDEISYTASLDHPGVFNSETCDRAMESKQFYAGEGLCRIVALTPSLAKFSEFCKFKHDFWVTRNNAMVDNIINRVREFHPKTVLVICGFEHRYYLRNGLREKSSREAILLKECWAY